MDVSHFADIAEIVGAGSILTGLVIGRIQLRHFRAG
jgi:hypothetical protein